MQEKILYLTSEVFTTDHGALNKRVRVPCNCCGPCRAAAHVGPFNDVKCKALHGLAHVGPVTSHSIVFRGPLDLAHVGPVTSYSIVFSGPIWAAPCRASDVTLDCVQRPYMGWPM